MLCGQQNKQRSWTLTFPISSKFRLIVPIIFEKKMGEIYATRTFLSLPSFEFLLWQQWDDSVAEKIDQIN